MKSTWRLMGMLLMAVGAWVLLAACGSTSPTFTPAPPTPENASTLGSDAQHTSAPAGGDFREDDAAWVAATGKPQLIEVFAHD